MASMEDEFENFDQNDFSIVAWINEQFEKPNTNGSVTNIKVLENKLEDQFENWMKELLELQEKCADGVSQICTEVKELKEEVESIDLIVEQFEEDVETRPGDEVFGYLLEIGIVRDRLASVCSISEFLNRIKAIGDELDGIFESGNIESIEEAMNEFVQCYESIKNLPGNSSTEDLILDRKMKYYNIIKPKLPQLLQDKNVKSLSYFFNIFKNSSYIEKDLHIIIKKLLIQFINFQWEERWRGNVVGVEGDDTFRNELGDRLSDMKVECAVMIIGIVFEYILSYIGWFNEFFSEDYLTRFMDLIFENGEEIYRLTIINLRQLSLYELVSVSNGFTLYCEQLRAEWGSKAEFYNLPSIFPIECDLSLICNPLMHLNNYYINLERKRMAELVKYFDFSNHETIEGFVGKLFVELYRLLIRCQIFTRNYQFTNIVAIISLTLSKFIDIFEDRLDRLKMHLVGKEDAKYIDHFFSSDLDKFFEQKVLVALNLLNTELKFKKDLANLQQFILEKFQLVNEKFSRIRNNLNYNADDFFGGLVQKSIKLPKMVSNEPNSEIKEILMEMGHLERPETNLTRKCQEFVVDLLIVKIDKLFSEVSSMRCWSEEKSSTSFHPQNYIKSIVECFLMISQKVMSYDKFNYSDMKIEMEEFQNLSISTDLSVWMVLVARKIQILFIDKILDIPYLSDSGCSQLTVDIKLLFDMLDMLKLEQHESLKLISNLLGIKPSEATDITHPSGPDRLKIFKSLLNTGKINPSYTKKF